MCENINENLEQIGNELGFIKTCIEPECKKCGIEHCTLDPVSCYEYYVLDSQTKPKIRTNQPCAKTITNGN